jgi:transposase
MAIGSYINHNKLQRKRPELWRNHNWLHHDNAPNHTSLKTTEFVTNNNIVIVNHPSYSPDLVPCDFAFFPKLKMILKGQCFETVSDIERESQAVRDSIKENDFHGAFEVWKKLWDRCTCSQGDYFEGDGNQN